MEPIHMVFCAMLAIAFAPLLLALFVGSIALLVDMLDDLCDNSKRFWRKHV